AAVVGWLLCGGCVLRPCGFGVPLLWPAALLAAGMAWIQALVWSPFPLPWLRLAALGVLLAGLVAAPALLVELDVGEARLRAGRAALVPRGYAAGLAGVGRARHGAGLDEPSRAEPVAGGQAAAIHLFSSPLWAQLWLEWRQNRWGILFLACMGLVCGVPVA